MNADPLVLTYHSISGAAGPTSIPPEVFSRQMAGLAEAGYSSMTLQDVLDWRAGKGAARRVLITFDDAFLDFPETAHPILKAHGFSSVVFVPTGKLGGSEDWVGANAPARPLMSWDHVVTLAADAVEFGGHAVTHADLTAVSPDRRKTEIEASGAELERRLGRPTLSFAAPYGHVNAAVLSELRGRYQLAFGTRFDRVRRSDDSLDMPRIEMHYFRDAARWRQFLRGDQTYFQARRLLRGVREAADRILPRRHA
jgi:peptidoglycan/xylan/chitin deacetylase (PgdA/CDA1 family)